MVCKETFTINGVNHEHLWDDFPQQIKVLNYILVLKNFNLDTECSKCKRTPKEMFDTWELYKELYKDRDPPEFMGAGI